MTEIICRLVSYVMNWVIKNRSDHYLIFTVLCFKIITQSQQQRWWWKSMNTEKVTAEAQHLHIFTHFIISEAIEQYTDYLMKFIKQFIRNIMLLVKSTADYFCSWWILKVDKTVCRVRETWKHEDHDKKIMKVNKHKKKIICRIKILQFWNSIHQIVFSSKNIWKLIKWVKKHSYFFLNCWLFLSCRQKQKRLYKQQQILKVK